MKRSDWARPVSADEALRRAIGRNAYNARRQFAAAWRRAQLAAVLVVYDWPQRGSQAQIAEHLGVSEATISRDLKHMTEQQHADWRQMRDLLKATDATQT